MLRSFLHGAGLVLLVVASVAFAGEVETMLPLVSRAAEEPPVQQVTAEVEGLR